MVFPFRTRFLLRLELEVYEKFEEVRLATKPSRVEQATVIIRRRNVANACLRFHDLDEVTEPRGLT
jgi:hypothetical protein